MDQWKDGLVERWTSRKMDCSQDEIEQEWSSERIRLVEKWTGSIMGLIDR